MRVIQTPPLVVMSAMTVLLLGGAVGPGSATHRNPGVTGDGVEAAVGVSQEPCGGRSANPRVPCQADVDQMMAALPDKAPAKPLKPRKVLVLGRAVGYVHSSIPLVAKTVEALGSRTGAWSTTVTYDAASIGSETLQQYDLVLLDNTTGCFLDDLTDKGATAARRTALVEFVRSGRGLVGLHAAADSYHGSACDASDGPARGRAGVAAARPGGLPLWPDFNAMIGGYFKFHWNDPQLITVKIDDPNSPLTAMFHRQEFEIHDETYTFNQESFSREKVHVLTSIDYAKMSDADKAKETNARSDHDYALSWIRREGKGRVFYEAHGHHERVYAMKPMLEHVVAGIQYALGDLKADDTPVGKAGTR